MLLVSEIKENTAAVLAGLRKKNFQQAEEITQKVIEVDKQRRETQHELDAVLANSKSISKKIGLLMKEGKKDEAEKIKQETTELKNKAKTLGDKLNTYETELHELLVLLPNLPHESVPAGKSAEDNVTEFQVENLPELSEGALPHWDLIKKYDIIDFELGNKVSGAGFPFYKGKGARLQRAIISYCLDKAEEAGYVEIQAPVVINPDSGFGTGQLPDKDGQMYHMEADNQYLIPTAEVPITNMYRDVILKENDLPVKHAGHTPCFRREAGSWGADVRGLNRLHQFDKVEIVQITLPEKSYEVLEEMKNHVQGLLKSLNLPYRILRLCGGDLSFTSALTFDFEVYSAAQKRWLEVSSVSNFETYQSNRLKLRYKSEGKTKLLHTLNGSALALPRIVAALLENNQTPDGIKIPEVLVPYTGFDKI
ncbi:serine--tRNA ligase [Cytophagaceae bacterium ABcell3]|nr:serine--tRNA ligase [Cytophagaceae bacterium ABcell3]